MGRMLDLLEADVSLKPQRTSTKEYYRSYDVESPFIPYAHNLDCLSANGLTLDRECPITFASHSTNRPRFRRLIQSTERTHSYFTL